VTVSRGVVSHQFASPDPPWPILALPSRMLTDAEAAEIRRGLAAGMRGPVLIKWCGQLLADRDEQSQGAPATPTVARATRGTPTAQRSMAWLGGTAGVRRPSHSARVCCRRRPISVAAPRPSRASDDGSGTAASTTPFRA
jgi:hypothetical protein